MSDLQIFSYQVAGSFPLLKRDPGEICKPATENELKVYTYMSEHHPSISKFAPKFMGKISLSSDVFKAKAQGQPAKADSLGKTVGDKNEKEQKAIDVQSQPDDGTGNEVDENNVDSKKRKIRNWSVEYLWKEFNAERCTKVLKSEDKDGNGKNLQYLYLVLENLTDKMSFPNILDLKMGTRQYGSNETSAKKLSKKLRCEKSTSKTLGLRIAGMQTFEKGNFSFKDKYWGRDLNETGLNDALKEFVSSRKTGVNKPIAKQIVSQVNELISAVIESKWKFYGCSVLITFDGKFHEEQQNDSDNLIVKVKVIDFAKTEINGGTGTSVDKGFVFGLKNLRDIFKRFL